MDILKVLNRKLLYEPKTTVSVLDKVHCHLGKTSTNLELPLLSPICGSKTDGVILWTDMSLWPASGNVEYAIKAYSGRWMGLE